MIKRILKYGAVAGASFVAGTIYQTIHINKNYQGDEPDDKIWEGERKELTVDVDSAEHHIELITECIDDGDYADRIFEEEDLMDVRRKLSHGVSDAKEKGESIFTVDMHDRERLRWIELWINSEPLLKENSK